MNRVRRAVRRMDRESGSAIVEFLGVALIFLIPLIYLVLVMARIQAASFAVESGAKNAGRAFVLAQDAREGEERALVAVTLAAGDHGFGTGDADLTIECDTIPCLDPGSAVTINATIVVVFPGIPASIRSHVPLHIPVSASSVTIVDELRVAP